MSEPRAKPRFAPRKKVVKDIEESSVEPKEESLRSGEIYPSVVEGGEKRTHNSAESNSRANSDRGARKNNRTTGGRSGRGSSRNEGGRGGSIANLSGKAFFSGNSGSIGQKLVTRKGKPTERAIASTYIKQESSEVVENVSEKTFGEHAGDTAPVVSRAGTGEARRSKSRGDPALFSFNIPADDAGSDSGAEDADFGMDKQFREDAPLSLNPAATSTKDDGLLLPLSENKKDLLKGHTDDIFLVQMPSSLPLARPAAVNRLPSALDPDVIAITTEPVAAHASKPGRIGKIQFMESGDAFIILADGTKFEVHRGLGVSFSQHLASIATTYSTNDVKVEAVDDAVGGWNRSDDTSRNGLFNMGKITAKWVVTPHIE